MKYFKMVATPKPEACLAPAFPPPLVSIATPAMSKCVQETSLSTKYLKNSAASIAPPHLYLLEFTMLELLPLRPSEIF